MKQILIRRPVPEEHGLSVNAFLCELIYREIGDYVPPVETEDEQE